MIDQTTTSLRHRIAVRLLGGLFVVAAFAVAFAGSVLVGSHLNQSPAQAETSVAPVTPGLCVIGCGLVSGAGSVGAPTDR